MVINYLTQTKSSLEMKIYNKNIVTIKIDA